MIYKRAKSQIDYNALREIFSEYFNKYNKYLGKQNFKKEIIDIQENTQNLKAV